MRYLPLTPEDRAEMLARVGVADIDALFAEVPADKRLKELPDLPLTKSEIEVERVLGRMAGRNVAAGAVPFFVGCGAYKHHVPASVDHLIQRSEFLTSYTPYQPEIAQGTLHYLFEFQTQVALLTGMEVANASMYDGSTATAEAVLMAHRVTKRKKAVLSGNLHPHYIETVETVSRLAGDELVVPLPHGAAEDLTDKIDASVSCVVVQNPDVFGQVRDLRPLAEKVHAAGALLVVVVTEVVSLGLVTPPGEMGADIVVGRGAVDRQWLELRRALCGPVRDAAEIRAPDAGAAGRRDRRCRRPARLRADALDARAAHQAREGDLEHLHQFRAVHARLQHPSHAARRSGPAPARAGQSRQCGRARGRARRRCRG